MGNTFIVGADLFDFADANWALVNRKVPDQKDNAAPKGGYG